MANVHDHTGGQELDPAHQALVDDYAREYGSALRNYFLKKGVQPATANDLTQNVFLRLVARESQNEIRNPRGYIMQTASSVWSDYWRRRKSKPDRDHTEYEDSEHSPESFDAERVLEGKEDLNLAMDTLKSLPDRTRQIYLLFYVEGVRRKELASLLGISTSAIDKHLATAKKKLGQVFGKRR